MSYFDSILSAVRRAVDMGASAVWYTDCGKRLSVGRGLDGFGVDVSVNGVQIFQHRGLTLREATAFAAAWVRENS